MYSWALVRRGFWFMLTGNVDCDTLIDGLPQQSPEALQEISSLALVPHPSGELLARRTQREPFIPRGVDVCSLER